MESQPDMQVEELTAFTSSPHESYRYVISLKGEKVNIWLENRSSKKQWQTGFLSKEDYVTPANAFVDASAAEYISCFKQCLDCPLEEGKDAGRKLTPQRGGKFQLELCVKIRLLRSARNICYDFELQPIAVERIDILESKLKDQQEELQKLQAAIHANKNNVFLYAKSGGLVGSKLGWKEVNTECFALDDDKTSIVVLAPGLYVLGILVHHAPVVNDSSGSIVLEVNGTQLQRAATGSVSCYAKGARYATQSHTSTSLMCITPVKKNACFSVTCLGTSVVTNMASYMTLARIGA
ncbi:hypothetical protein F444_02982 [Phytophthora nicotianae P1976]|uniref:Uncharacterized protein n=1 Tax=Phytophthora nicotianae P1976 TaxID=1317066 RepID=A0A081AVL7_PHYNI|nr:hypothetical protein F444_02982 [Phytophthora nicotianae P1976]